MMKRAKILAVMLFVVVGLCVVTDKAASADFLYNVPILEKAAIQSLSDTELIDKYIDVMVELEASRTFHATSGFSSAKEYEKYKELIKYRIYLEMELQKRELDAPELSAGR